MLLWLLILLNSDPQAHAQKRKSQATASAGVMHTIANTLKCQKVVQDMQSTPVTPEHSVN
jgi:hypothetical protein